jgi:hypothetical protein
MTQRATTDELHRRVIEHEFILHGRDEFPGICKMVIDLKKQVSTLKWIGLGDLIGITGIFIKLVLYG